MLNSRWYTTPFAIFCFMILALGSAVVTYVKAFLKVDKAFTMFVKQQDLDTFYQLNSAGLATILTLSVLFALVVGGSVLVFIYYKKVVQLYYMQKNFINGFTHELKTPVTSLKLFLETLSAHDLSRESWCALSTMANLQSSCFWRQVSKGSLAQRTASPNLSTTAPSLPTG